MVSVFTEIFIFFRISMQLRAESNCAESIIKMILRGVTLYCMRGVNGHFLKLLHRPLKGQCHRNKYKFRLCSKKATFLFLRQCSRITFFFTPSSMILREVSFFHTSKLRISQRKRNQIRKYFNPLVSNRRWVEWWKQLEVENVVGLSL